MPKNKTKPTKDYKQVGGTHYDQKIQHVDFVVANEIPYMDAQVMRYICRHDRKNGAEDVRKAMHYCEMILEKVYNEKP